MEVTAPVTDYIKKTFITDNEASAENAGLVTIGAGSTEIVDLDLGTVAVGDRFFMGGYYEGVKTTTGTVRILIKKKSGTATITFLHDTTDPGSVDYTVNGQMTGVSISAILKVTGAGTLVMRMVGNCIGGTVAVQAGDGDLYAAKLQGA